jgi:hypothetical protein
MPLPGIVRICQAVTESYEKAVATVPGRKPA